MTKDATNNPTELCQDCEFYRETENEEAGGFNDISPHCGVTGLEVEGTKPCAHTRKRELYVEALYAKYVEVRR